MYVIIDSGHNKNIAGKRSPDESLLEYEFNFDVANKIAAHLKRHGVKVEVMQMQTSDLWADIEYKDGYRIIPDTLTVTTAFAKDECGWWNGVLYRSLLGANVYTPAVYPDGWEKV